MARAHLRFFVKDRAGNAVQNALVYVYLSGTTTAVPDLYAGSAGGSPITTLTSNGQGEIEGWLGAAKQVDLKVTDNSDTAYYPTDPGLAKSFSDFTETVEVLPPPAEIRNFVSVKDAPYYALGDGSNDDTAEIQAAIDAAPVGSTVFFPAGTYKVTTLDLDKNITLLGAGWRHDSNAAFGNAAWVNAANFNGSVILVTATSGVGVDVDATASRRVFLRDLAVIGPGSGTTTGLRCGNASSMHGGLSNVGIFNFATGLSTGNLISASVYDLVVRGCTTGIHAPVGGLANACNWYNTEVQFTSAHGIYIESGNVNNFYGGTLQNISGTAGVRTASGVDTANFDGWYVEGVTATDSFLLAGGANSITKTRWASNGGQVTLAGNNGYLAVARHISGSAPLVITGNDNRCLNFSGFAAPTDSGLRNTFEPSGSVGGQHSMHGALIQRVVEATDADTTPSVLGVNVIYFTNGSACSVTDFDDAVEGQVLHVKLDANTTLVHGSSTMRLDGSADIVGATNLVVTLVHIGAIWYETARSDQS